MQREQGLPCSAGSARHGTRDVWRGTRDRVARNNAACNMPDATCDTPRCDRQQIMYATAARGSLGACRSVRPRNERGCIAGQTTCSLHRVLSLEQISSRATPFLLLRFLVLVCAHKPTRPGKGSRGRRYPSSLRLQETPKAHMQTDAHKRERLQGRGKFTEGKARRFTRLQVSVRSGMSSACVCLQCVMRLRVWMCVCA